MNGILPRLTVALATAGSLWPLLLAVGHGEPERLRRSGSSDQDASSVLVAAAKPLSSNALIRAAASKLEKQQSVAARVRLQVRMFDAELVGAGIYLQLASDGLPRFLWELRTQVAGETSSLVQVADGRFLWTDRILPSGQSITRVDLKRLAKPNVPPGVRPAVDLRDRGPGVNPLATGGLPRLLASLDEHYRFQPPVQRSLLGLPVDTLVGTRKQGQETRRDDDATKNAGESSTNLMPHRVQVYLGRDDLFPYLIEYFAAHAADEGASSVPVLRIQLHDVQLDGRIDDRRFAYTPADPNWHDITDDLLKPDSKRTP